MPLDPDALPRLRSTGRRFHVKHRGVAPAAVPNLPNTTHAEQIRAGQESGQAICDPGGVSPAGPVKPFVAEEAPVLCRASGCWQTGEPRAAARPSVSRLRSAGRVARLLPRAALVCLTTGRSAGAGPSASDRPMAGSGPVARSKRLGRNVPARPPRVWCSAQAVPQIVLGPAT